MSRGPTQQYLSGQPVSSTPSNSFECKTFDLNTVLARLKTTAETIQTNYAANTEVDEHETTIPTKIATLLRSIDVLTPKINQMQEGYNSVCSQLKSKPSVTTGEMEAYNDIKGSLQTWVDDVNKTCTTLDELKSPTPSPETTNKSWFSGITKIFTSDPIKKIHEELYVININIIVYYNRAVETFNKNAGQTIQLETINQPIGELIPSNGGSRLRKRNAGKTNKRGNKRGRKNTKKSHKSRK